MTRFIVKEGRYDAVYEFIAPSMALGGSGNKSAYSNVFSFYQDLGELDDALVDVALLLSDANMRRWKISLEGVVLTREFKPYTCVELSRGYVCKLLFDVAPIIRSKPLDSYRVVVTHPEMVEAQLIHMGFLTVFSRSDALSKMVYVADPLILAPGDEATLELPLAMSDAELKMSVFIPHAAASLLVEADGSRFEIRGYQGGLEVSRRVGKVSRLRLMHEGDGSYMPKEIIVSSLFAYSSNAPQPSVAIESLEPRGDRIRVRLANRGQAASTHVVVVAICLGSVADRKIVEKLEPGEAVELELQGCKEATTIVRAVWRHHGETRIAEQRVRL